MAEKKDFFISYTGKDKGWAEWIAWKLEEEGYSTIIQAWDFRPSTNFVTSMHEAVKNSERTIAVLSEDYEQSGFAASEWAAAFAKDPRGVEGTLLPVRIAPFTPEGLLNTIVYIDLVDTDEDQATTLLLNGVKTERAKPSIAPAFPSTPSVSQKNPKPFPGNLPPVWKVPFNQNLQFTGREELLLNLHQSLNSGNNAALTQAIAGLGGIGKTQLALEYTYRYKSDYKIIWWLAAENPVTLESDYAELARDLGLTSGEETELSELIKKVRHHLGNRSDWLLVFDNAGDKKSITSFLPQGTSGHVVITSRNKDWQGVAKSLTVYKWDRAESIDYLIKRTRIENREGANKLAKTLGDLPLALAQASAFIAQRSLIDSYEKYLSRYKTNRQKIREREHQPLNYDEKVETTWLMNFEQVEKESKAGILLLKICSFLAPEGIPQLLFNGLCDPSGDEERPHIEDKIELEEGLEILASYSLIDFQGDDVSIHRLVQEVMIDQLEEDEKFSIISISAELMIMIWPDVLYDKWLEKETLLPHAELIIDHSHR